MTVRPTPVTDGQLSQADFPSDPEGAFSCVAYSFAYAAADATNGSSIHSGQVVRNWTGDHLGGLELGQCDLAMHKNAHIEFDTQVDTWPEFLSKLAKGYGAVILGGYGPIADSPFSGQDSFRGNHGIYVPSSFKAMDPLADGRARMGGTRAYKYGGFPYPQTLIHEFMANLRLGSGARAGYNHVEASYIRKAPATAPLPVLKYRASVSAGQVNFYHVDPNNVATLVKVGQTGGFSGSCTAPRLYKWQPAIKRPYIRLIRMTSGGYSGLYINTSNPRVTVRLVP